MVFGTKYKIVNNKSSVTYCLVPKKIYICINQKPPMDNEKIKSADQRAKELHDKIKDARNKRQNTTAVGNTEQEVTLVGTNDRYLRKEIREALEENEIEVPSIIGNHAEENVIAEAEKQNLNMTEIGASRNICSDCEKLIKKKDIKTKTPFSGKPSKKRK